MEILSINEQLLLEKFDHLQRIIRSLGKLAIAYSGGVDSTFLLAAAHKAPAERLIAMTVKKSYTQHWELDEARTFVEKLGVEYVLLEPGDNEQVMKNPVNRCYLCKSDTFSLFHEEMKHRGFDTLADGSNADDTGEYRPGMQAKLEQGVRSPLLEAGLHKAEIRELSRRLGIPDWDKPSNTCLITRMPYDTLVTRKDLRQIEQAEKFLMDSGFRQVRVRKHDDAARIEVDPWRIAELAAPDTINKVVPYLKSLGFSHVSIDLEGYKTGSMDYVVNRPESRS